MFYLFISLKQIFFYSIISLVHIYNLLLWLDQHPNKIPGSRSGTDQKYNRIQIRIRPKYPVPDPERPTYLDQDSDPTITFGSRFGSDQNTRIEIRIRSKYTVPNPEPTKILWFRFRSEQNIRLQIQNRQKYQDPDSDQTKTSGFISGTDQNTRIQIRIRQKYAAPDPEPTKIPRSR